MCKQNDSTKNKKHVEIIDTMKRLRDDFSNQNKRKIKNKKIIYLKFFIYHRRLRIEENIPRFVTELKGTIKSKIKFFYS